MTDPNYCTGHADENNLNSMPTRHNKMLEECEYQIALLQYVLYCTRCEKDIFLPVPPIPSIDHDSQISLLFKIKQSREAIAAMLGDEHATERERELVLNHPSIRYVNEHHPL